MAFSQRVMKRSRSSTTRPSSTASTTCRHPPTCLYAALPTRRAETLAEGVPQELSTFGFRGEALSSLCALAEVSVVTRTADGAAGVRLTYNHAGKLTGTAATARAPGTTVAVRELFKPLPVRFKVCASRAEACVCSSLGRDACAQAEGGLLMLAGVSEECEAGVCEAAHGAAGVCIDCNGCPPHLHQPRARRLAI